MMYVILWSVIASQPKIKRTHIVLHLSDLHTAEQLVYEFFLFISVTFRGGGYVHQICLDHRHTVGVDLRCNRENKAVTVLHSSMMGQIGLI